jgi:hypothetical protein
MRNKEFGILLVILFSLSSVLFFFPHGINISIAYYIYYALFFIAILYIILFTKGLINNVFSIPILLLLIAAIISGICAFLFWHQNLFNSFVALTFFLSYLLFFFLGSLKLSIRDVEKIIIILGILYISAHLYSFLSYPQLVFGQIRLDINRGFPRIILPGWGFLFLLSFYAMGKYLKTHLFFWLIMLIITIVFIILTLTRQLIAVSFLFLSLFALYKAKQLYKIGAVIVIASIFSIISQMSFFKLLSDQTISEASNFENNIRVKSAEFYLNNFSPNIFTKVLGNGEPYDSAYNDYMTYLELGLGFFTSDIGYIGLYIKFGLLAIVAYLVLILRTIKIQASDDYLYCKYFLYFVFVTSILGNCTFSTDFIISIVLALYILSYKDLSSLSIIKETYHVTY